MPKFIHDPILDAYFEMLRASNKKFSDVPDIDVVLEDSTVGISDADKKLISECQKDSESIERYLNELVIPQIHERISKLPEQYVPSMKKYVSSRVIKSLESL